jgi:hypothetical protein
MHAVQHLNNLSKCHTFFNIYVNPLVSSLQIKYIYVNGHRRQLSHL